MARSWSASELSIEPTLTLMQKILLCTDGTVTDLLALYDGGPIHARKIRQSLVKAPLGRTLHREVVLENANGLPYVYANSQFMVDRFSIDLQRNLLETEIPIGLLWQRERLEMYREIIDRQSLFDHEIARLLQVASDTLLLSRCYRIYQAGITIGKITENFATTTLC